MRFDWKLNLKIVLKKIWLRPDLFCWEAKGRALRWVRG